MPSDDDTLLPESSDEATLMASSGSTGPTSREIGRYTIMRRLGSGGMGSVFEAKDPELDRVVAIKLLLTEGVGSEGEVRLRREARTLARLSHPNLVPVHDVGEEGGQLYIVMERIHGVTLGEWARDEAPSYPSIASKLAQVARGLEAAHRSGVVHRDVKPSNVMIDAEGRVRVLDFGVARPMSQAPAGGDESVRTAAGALVGTPAYMTPEQIEGGELSPATDAFALGIVLYELLAGERPFRAKSSVSLLHAILTAQPNPLPERIPAQLRDLVERLLRKDPSERPKSLGEVAEVLESFGTQSASSTQTATPPAKPPPEKKLPWGLMAAGAGVLALAAWAFSGGPDHDPPAPVEDQSPPEPPDAERTKGNEEDAEGWRTVPLAGQFSPTMWTVGVARDGSWRAHVDNSGAHFGTLRGGDDAAIAIEGEVIAQIVGANAKSDRVLLRTRSGRVWSWNPDDGSATATKIESDDTSWYVSPDGSMAISIPPPTMGLDRTQLWSFEDGRVEEIPGRPHLVAWGPDSKHIVLITPDGSELVVSTLEVNPLGAPRQVGVLAGARGLQWTREGLAYCTTVGAQSQLWRASFGAKAEQIGEPERLAEFAGECWRLWAQEDGSYVVSVGAGIETRLGTIEDLSSGNQLMPIKRGVQPIGWSGEGIVVAGRVGKNFVMEVATPGKPTRRLLDHDVGPMHYFPLWLGGDAGALYTLKGGQGVWVTAAGERRDLKGIWHPRMKAPDEFVIAAARGKAVYLGMWSAPVLEAFELDPTTQAPRSIARFPTGAAVLGERSWRSAALSPDGREFAMISGMTDVTLQIFDLEKETIRSVSLDMESDVELVQYIAWLPEGEGWIAAGMASEAPGYRVWKIDPTGKAKRAFASPSDWLYLPQVSDDGTQLAIAAKAVETQLMILEPPR